MNQCVNLSCGCESTCEHVSMCVSQHVVGCQFFILFILFLCMCVCESARAYRGSYFKGSGSLGGHFEVFDSQRHFPFPLVCSYLYWPWDPLSPLESTPVSI